MFCDDFHSSSQNDKLPLVVDTAFDGIVGMPRDLFPLELAATMGASSHRQKFPVPANIYAGDPLKRWAFDLGWREAAFLDQRAKEIRLNAVLKSRMFQR